MKNPKIKVIQPVILVIILFFCGHIPSAYSDNNLQLVKKYIAQDDPNKALQILRPLLRKKATYDVYLLSAQSYAELNKPLLALKYYQAARNIAKQDDERHVADFGRAKTEFWLDHYQKAADIYRHLLSENLNKEDHELALAGLVKSLTYLNKPRWAYSLIPKNLVYTTPNMVIASAQASLWANWADITKKTITQYQSIINQIVPDSTLSRDFQDVKWQTDLETSPNILTPGFFYSSDSDNFIERISSANYARYWSQQWQTQLGIRHYVYTQNNFHLSANQFDVGQTWKPTRDLIFNGHLIPSTYNGWDPFLWSASGIYLPNDVVKLNFLTYKELVETFPAFEHRISDTSYELAVVIDPSYYIRLTAGLGALQFTDTNNRYRYLASIQVLLSADLGLSAILQSRGYKDKFQSPFYFSPLWYQAEDFILQLSRKFGATWHYYLDAGIGGQTIHPNQFTSNATVLTYQWGGGIYGPITRSLIFRAYYFNTTQASAFMNSSGYHYQYAAVSLDFLF